MEQILLPMMEYIQNISPNLMEERDILSIVAWVPILKISFSFLKYAFVDFIRSSNIAFPIFRSRETIEPNLYSRAK